MGVCTAVEEVVSRLGAELNWPNQPIDVLCAGGR